MKILPVSLEELSHVLFRLRGIRDQEATRFSSQRIPPPKEEILTEMDPLNGFDIGFNCGIMFAAEQLLQTFFPE